MSRKEQILTTAIRLFNEKGYANVTLREIAKEAGTTIGNLTYHFPQKEDLLLCLLDTLQTEFVLDVPAKKHGADLLSHLLNSFLIAEKNEKEHPFYYKNIYELTMCSATIAERNKGFEKELYDYYKQIFVTLKHDKVFRAEISERDLETMAYVVVLMTTTWLQENAPYRNELLPDYGLALCLSNMVRRNISDEFMEEFDFLLKEKGTWIDDNEADGN